MKHLTHFGSHTFQFTRVKKLKDVGFADYIYIYHNALQGQALCPSATRTAVCFNDNRDNERQYTSSRFGIGMEMKRP